MEDEEALDDEEEEDDDDVDIEEEEVRARAEGNKRGLAHAQSHHAGEGMTVLATSGGVGGYWSMRQSRPSSPRMPPPEQEQAAQAARPRSRHEQQVTQQQALQPPSRYNNLGYWRARRVTFYRNGDPYFPGVEFR